MQHDPVDGVGLPAVERDQGLMERIHDIELFRLRRRGAVQPVGAAAISRRGSRAPPGRRQPARRCRLTGRCPMDWSDQP